ncbi:MAG: inner nuclear membrane protein enriched at telomere/subtelomere region [Sclerophora amabilis]|nr:MAG: inner nuclear membrane protein enriched at telomere/subtelomere region [Sclerophora amabilis]
MSDSELEYLNADFDPSKLTVDRLRGILVSHDVKYPSSAKKAQLVDLFNNNVLPQARKILRAQSRIKRTSKGIENVDSGQAGSVPGEDGDHLLEPSGPDATRKRGGRKTGSSLAGVGAEDDLKPEAATKKTPGRRSNSKRPHSTDAETGAQLKPNPQAMRKSRKSEGQPLVKMEEPEETNGHIGRGDNVFSSENPFQSGSSPLSGDARLPSGAGRRKSSGPPINKDAGRRKSAAVRRKTDNFAAERLPKAEDGIVVPSSQRFEVPIKSLKREPRYDDSETSVEAGEEFTPEGEAELERERAMNGGKELLPPRKGQKQKGPGRISKSAPWVVLLTLLGGYATWWRREKIEVGYCGIGSPSTTLADYQIPDWASVLQPHCEPCPNHAYCSEDLITQCERDFVLKPHPLSLGGLVPLAPTCEPDGEKVRKVKAVADRAVEELRERRAKYECGELTGEGQKGTPRLELSETNLREAVGEKRRKGLTQNEFENLWQSALGEVLERDEITVGTDEWASYFHHRHSSRLALASTSLSRLSLSCTIRRSARLTLARYRIQLGGLVALCLIGITLLGRLRSLNAAKARVPNLVGLTLDRLAAHATIHAQDPRAAPEPWISVGQLRDDVLRDEFSAKRREELWRRVKAVVEMNANVRASVREARGGEVSRVWEWIGSVGLLEDAGAWGAGRPSRRRESERWLPQPTGKEMNGNVEEDRAVERERQEMIQTQRSRWDEGRPIY